MRILPASDSSLLVVFGDAITPELRDRVVALFRLLESKRDPRIRNLHPGYASLLIDFDPLRLSHEELSATVEQLCNAEAAPAAELAKTVDIPVCYDPEFAPDLLEVAAHANLPPEEVIRLHASATYLVYFLGFTPGFAYLGGLPPALHTPRLATPRKVVPAGAVGIAGSQTGVYPVSSPGGWRLIGYTPLRMFDPQANPPSLLQPGDNVNFSPISRATYEAMLHPNALKTGASGTPLHPNAPKTGASGTPLHPNAPKTGASGTPLHPNAPKTGASGTPLRGER